MPENKLLTKLKEKARELKYNLSALYLAYKRKDVPIYAKIVVLITIGYALSPIDLIPDFIPIFGYLDDLIILPFLIYISLKLIPKEIIDLFNNHKNDIVTAWEREKRHLIPKRFFLNGCTG
jgi:uncharacterized membrane protein YkvA (DUF1232 family)